MKKFTRIEPTEVQIVGNRFKSAVVIKHFLTDDGLEHEFTTIGPEGRQGAATVALTRDGQVVVVKQFRAGREDWCYDLPGGRMRDDEDSETGARRELLEETGYTAGIMEYLGQYSWDGCNNLKAHYYFAENCTKNSTQENLQDQIERDQGAEPMLIEIDQLIEYAVSDKVGDATAVLMAYDRLQAYKNNTSLKGSDNVNISSTN